MRFGLVTSVFGLAASMFRLMASIFRLVTAVLGLVTAVLGFVAPVFRLVASMLGFASCGSTHYVPFTDRTRDVSWRWRVDDDFRATLNKFGLRRRRGPRFNNIGFLDCEL